MTIARITAFPRIHITLVDLSGGTGRRYGGAGFALDGLASVVLARKASRTRTVGPSGFGKRDLEEIAAAVARIARKLKVRFDVNVHCEAPAHVGLGTKTACVLGALIACNTVAGNPLCSAELVRLARRGGASGVGVNTAFIGGFVADAGHPAAPSGRGFSPSSAVIEPQHPPPATVRLTFPAAWRVHLFLPEGQRVTGAAEREFFDRNTPLPRAEVLEVLAQLYHGIVPAIATHDLSGLARSLRHIQNLGFKRKEVNHQGRAVQNVLHALSELKGLAPGMSSLGPLVYGIAAKESSQLRDQFTARWGATYLGEFEGRNGGILSAVETGNVPSEE